jgi:hypothetical protein
VVEIKINSILAEVAVTNHRGMDDARWYCHNRCRSDRWSHSKKLVEEQI